MDSIRRTTPLRRVAMTASLAALLVPAGTAEAAKKKIKQPTISSVTPKSAKVGDQLTITGKHFKKGKRKNSVGFKADGAAVVFVKAKLSTTRKMYVTVPAKLEKVMAVEDGELQPTRFALRILAKRFGKSFTSSRLSPVIAPRPPKPAAPGAPGAPAGPGAPVAPPDNSPEADCDKDGQVNSKDADDDNDLLSDAQENDLGTDGCKYDTDGDGVGDGYEFRSAIDLNDDQYQQPNRTTAAPIALGYPNALFADAGTDYDGDGLPLSLEHKLWLETTPAAQRTLATPAGGAVSPLNYSDGLQYSISRFCATGNCDGTDPAGTHDGRIVPALAADNYDKYQQFQAWVGQNGYDKVWLHDSGEWFDHADGRFLYDIRDIDRDGVVDPDTEAVTLDSDGNGWLSDDERDEDADGLDNHAEYLGAMRPDYWAACYAAERPYPVTYSATDPAKRDSDGDGVIDGVDDQDHDDVPNLMELSRMAASHADDTDDGVTLEVEEGMPVPEPTTGGGEHCVPDEELDPDVLRNQGVYGQVNPFNPCMPDRRSRTCGRSFPVGAAPAPFSGPDWWSLQ